MYFLNSHFFPSMRKHSLTCQMERYAIKKKPKTLEFNFSKWTNQIY